MQRNVPSFESLKPKNLHKNYFLRKKTDNCTLPFLSEEVVVTWIYPYIYISIIYYQNPLFVRYGIEKGLRVA